MHAVILAAGVGRRMRPMGWDRPKCLLEISGSTLLRRALDALPRFGVTEIVIVVGFRADLVRRSVESVKVPVSFVMNDDFETTNTLHSAWLARQYFRNPFVLLNGDVAFDDFAVERLRKQSGSALLVNSGPPDSEAVKVVMDKSQRVLRIGKQLPINVCQGEFVGVGQFDARGAGEFLDELERLETEGRGNLFFEEALDACLSRHPVTGVDLAGIRAIEIDTPEDYSMALTLLGENDPPSPVLEAFRRP